jgi:hypothetical protein
MIQDEERRHCERVAFLRPIVYTRDKAGKFIRATMLNFCSSGICFQSTPPVAPGEKIYVITEEFSTGFHYDKTGDAICGEVMWCRKKAGAYQVGVHYLGYLDTAFPDDGTLFGYDSRVASGFEH